MNFKQAFLSGFFFLLSIFSFSETFLLPQAVIKLEFGDDASKLGSSGSGDDEWKPLFFTVLEDGTIAVPDINKGRVALYSATGVFTKAFPVTAALSPRMNYFAASGNGRYVTFNDGALYCLAASGELLWRAPFPMGVFPKAVYAGADGVAFSVDESDGVKSFSIPYVPPFTPRDTTVTVSGVRISSFRAYGHIFGYTIGDTSRLRAAAGEAGFGLDLPAKARFLEAEKDGRAIWIEKEEDAYAVYLSAADGKLVTSGRIARKPSAPWYWAVARFEVKQAAVYVYEEESGAMRIGKYLVR